MFEVLRLVTIDKDAYLVRVMWAIANAKYAATYSDEDQSSNGDGNP